MFGDRCWNNNARQIFRSQDIQLVLLHAVAAVARFVPVFHISIRRYLNKRCKEALTSMKQLFNVAHVDG
jgi:hypothetical protein